MKKYNTILKRILAVIIDVVILFPIDHLESLYMNKSVLLFAVGKLATTAIYIFYFTLLHAKYGQTVGKIVAELKVMDISESRLINYKKSILRILPFIIINLAVLLYVIIRFGADVSKAEEEFYELSSTISLIWISIELIYILSNKKRRAIHDIVADSVVIKVPA